MAEEDEIALMFAVEYVEQPRQLLADHLAKIARLKSQGKETVVLAASASQASSSVSVGSAMEAANVAATFAGVKQKLNRTLFDD
jgi:hypothetical protein